MLQLLDFDFTIMYRPGKENTDADAFYRTSRASAVCVRGDVGMQAPHMRVKRRRREKIKRKNKKMPGKDVEVGTYISNTLGITHT